MPAGLPAAAPFVMPSVLSGDRAGDDTADGKGENQARTCRLDSPAWRSWCSSSVGRGVEMINAGDPSMATGG
jgi:hypothetical protein